MSFKGMVINYSTPTSMLLVIFIVIRILTLDALPLVDPSESRYASIAQTSVISGNWIVPEFDRGDGPIPFIGKPPLFLWLCTLSMNLLGQDEWTSRLPSLFSSFLILFLIYQLSRRVQSEETAKIATLALLTSFGFFALAGSCMYDMMLAAGITLAMGSFLIAALSKGKEARFWGWMVFAGMFLGFMIKGPIAIVLSIVPILVWIVRTRSWGLVRAIPWLGGSSLAIALAVVFFAMIEREMPGFNYYFFVQENFLRFVSGEYGDRFGTSHSVPLGTSWLFLILMGLPWSLFFFREMYRVIMREIRLPKAYTEIEKTRLYLLLWAGAAPGLFTLTHGVLFTYVLPAIPPLAVLSAPFIQGFFDRKRRLAVLLATGVPLVGIVLPLIYEAGLMPKYSTREVIESLDEDERVGTVYFYPKQPFSALFYTRREPEGVSLQFVHDLSLIPAGALLVSRKSLSAEQAQQYHLKSVRTVERSWYLYRKEV